MIVNTRRLFIALLRRMQINAVCDVGSMNGADALAFRAAVPAAAVHALEPNPDNFRHMNANPVFRQRHIQVAALAATNFDGEADFFLVAEVESQPTRRGMSSLYRRSDSSAPTTSGVRVKTIRLDTLLGSACQAQLRLALWIDSEGKAYEVIEGATGLAAYLYLIHIEVETAPCIAAGQRLYPDVKALLQRLGFHELATDRRGTQTQLNVLFVRADLPAGMRYRVQVELARARARQFMVATLSRLCPACIRRYQARRLRRTARATRED